MKGWRQFRDDLGRASREPSFSNAPVRSTVAIRDRFGVHELIGDSGNDRKLCATERSDDGRVLVQVKDAGRPVQLDEICHRRNRIRISNTPSGPKRCGAIHRIQHARKIHKPRSDPKTRRDI